QAEIVFVEGKTFRQIRSLLDSHPDVRHDSAGLSDGDILVRIGASEPHPEGLFFPDTYLFAKQSSDLDILRRAYRAMQARLAAEWNSRDPSVPYAGPYEALIMASIVEKETGQPADRLKVAAVFVNRLKKGMLLQTDPTVIYGMGERFDGNIRKYDLTTDTPYNTYTRTGLPPTPIALPGQASIQAALHPPASDLYYFVARGDGSSEFSRNLDEHNRAVAKYQKRRGG
ncbi:MAG: endolytic transglycosylase MltG, partial [Cyanobacteria bacterium]|nr:endolytic transglycosylase MltG [Cyanobacteriota bacterium]